MKTAADLVKGRLRKADSDLTNAGLCIEQEQALDTACFHAQQAAEKCLKAYLTACAIEFPFIHNLEKLIELCAQRDTAFVSLKALSQEPTLMQLSCATMQSSLARIGYRAPGIGCGLNRQRLCGDASAAGEHP